MQANFAALQRYLNVSASHPGIADGNVVNSTSNRLGLAPPPAKVLLNCEIVLSATFSYLLVLFIND
jgi:hypothetical protein